MDLGRFRKAIAGGATAAIAALLGTGGVVIQAPSGAPSWEQWVLTGVGAFIVGFFGVLLAPANALTPEQKTDVLVDATADHPTLTVVPPAMTLSGDPKIVVTK